MTLEEKAHRCAEAAGEELSIEELRGIAAELDHVFPQTTAPRSIKVNEPDGTQTIVGEGPIGAVMSRSLFEGLKALSEMRLRPWPFRFGWMEIEEDQG